MEAASPGGNRRFRILIIEDSLTYQKILKTYFEREGFEVFTSETGEEGLELVVKDRPDLIVCDFMLPGMNGDEVCAKIKLQAPLRDIPIVMLTSRSRRADIATSLESGADDYVVKSGDIDLLLLRVRNLLRNRVDLNDSLHLQSGIHSPRILTIDDDRYFSKYVGDLLRQEGYRVHSVHNGQAGLDAVEQQSFDCVIVDFIMPGLQGDEVCRALKSKETFRDIPVILLTTRGDRKDMIAGLNAGADDYILKTIDKDVLRSRIRALLRRKFIQDENRRILEELKAKEFEATKARLDRDHAEARARLSDELKQKNLELEAINRKLRETQAGMIQAEKMAALGLLVAGIAHEINNPLAYVLNNLETIRRDIHDLEMLLAGYRKFLPAIESWRPEVAQKLRQLEVEHELGTVQEEINNLLEDSQDGIEQIKNLVRNLRNFSRLDEGEIQTVDVTEGLKTTLKIIAHMLSAEIQVDEYYGDIPRIECYPGLLNQVFMNLLVNATQAIDGKGRITIRTYLEGEFVQIEITDNGCGMSPETMTKIFDPFYTTKPLGSGTGLGLSTTYGIVAKHGGNIQVESTLGKGTRFKVTLPQRLPARDGVDVQGQATV